MLVFGMWEEREHANATQEVRSQHSYQEPEPQMSGRCVNHQITVQLHFSVNIEIKAPKKQNK